MSLYPACRECGEPATFEVRGSWGDVWEQACDTHKAAAARRALDVLAAGSITVRDIVPRAMPPRMRRKQ